MDRKPYGIQKAPDGVDDGGADESGNDTGDKSLRGLFERNMKTTYKLTSDKLDGHLKVVYDKGLLKAFQIEVKNELTPKQYGVFLSTLSFSETRVRDFEAIGLRVMLEAGDRTNSKISIFCRLYERYIGVKYKVSRADAGKMKHIKVDEPMLVHYFQSTNFLFSGKWSISNLVKYYNELLAEIARQGKPQYPSGWDAAFAAKLQGTELSAYWGHLRELGLKPVRDRQGNVVDWR